MIVSINARIALDKIHQPFTKTLNKLRIEGKHLNIVKAIYGIFPVSNILYGERLKTILLRLETRQGCSISPLVTIVLKVVAREIR